MSIALHVTQKTENEMLADLDKQAWLDNTLVIIVETREQSIHLHHKERKVERTGNR